MWHFSRRVGNPMRAKIDTVQPNSGIVKLEPIQF